MENLYQQTLAAMAAEDVNFILSQLPQPDAAIANSAAGNDPVTGAEQTEEDEETRRRIEREWPDVGRILTADYCGTTYTAEIVPASKRLKSGKQILKLSLIG